jgi:hypothetical protein
LVKLILEIVDVSFGILIDEEKWKSLKVFGVALDIDFLGGAIKSFNPFLPKQMISRSSAMVLQLRERNLT